LPGGGRIVAAASGAGILNSAANAENAQRFVDYLLLAEGQQYFADETFEYPVIDGVALPAALPPLVELDAVAVDFADRPGRCSRVQDLLIELGIIE
jgi:iron(III) transport system substrate-binding protein